MASPTDRPATLDKAYEPHAIERRLYDTWEQTGAFRPSGQGPSYCIMIPPPNVTGSLHMGHAFNNTVMDALTRWHRMRGDNTLWQPGTDHAGIATQMVVERQLNAEGKTRHDLGREKFIQRVWTWKTESGGNITRQLRRMGASLDWSRERFTMDPAMSEAVTEVFVRLFDEGLIYRGKRLVNWDPVLHTAVSDLEVVSEEEVGSMWHIRYPIVNEDLFTTKEFLVVATTRPETLLGDSAVAVHPEDERYKHLIGKQVELPLTGRTIPVVADDYVDKEFGSGCVKITPAHDFNDYEVGKRHDLPLFCIFTKDAKIVGATDWPMAKEGLRHAKVTVRHNIVDSAIDIGIPEKYWGMDRYEARKAIVADLEEAGLLAEVKPHKLMVPRGDRSGAVIEPYLTDQWYVKAGPLAKVATKVVEDGRIKFFPANWDKTYYEWMRNIQDWCISRQIWWGHRIPAWYDNTGIPYVGRSEQEARVKYFKELVRDSDKFAALQSSAEKSKTLDALSASIEDFLKYPDIQDALRKSETVSLTQDEDFLDTWFSSALWPFSTLGWPKQTAELKAFYPTSVLVTGFDIIFFWVARMVMMGMKFMDDVPFKEVYIHGLVRDAHGQKMSKSKGNVLDPIDLIDGIDLEALVKKRTSGLMQPQMAKKIEQATRKEFPAGIPAFGTDALRFTFASQATQGRDIKFDLNRVEGYRNFCNKLWNAARYVLMNTEAQDCGLAGKLEFNAADRWIVSRLNEVAAEVDTAFREYRFDLASQAIYSFTWNEYCDWYLELSKVVLNDPKASAAAQRGTRRTLVQVLETLLRLLHPITPFITEEIWQRVATLAGKTGRTIMREPYPQADRAAIDHQAVEEMRWVMNVIAGIRNIRGEMDIAPSKLLPVLLQDASAQDLACLERNRATLTTLARTESITCLQPGDAAPESATALVGDMKVLVPLGSIINKQAELERLTKEIEKKEKDLQKEQTKLTNSEFVARAPKQVVEEVNERVRQCESALASLRAQHTKVSALPG
jgi:valyl-tRNA synthetase